MEHLPQAVGRYTVEDVVGEGGMGRVLLAHDPVLERRVAIKVMRDDLGMPPEVRAAVLARMRQEARAAAAVSHPNMITLHDMGEEEPVGLYLVFEYVEGPTLRQLIEDEVPEPKTVVRVAREVASALDRAHAAGVIHRDVKPENILLSPTGAKIGDFGIARMPDSTLTLQSTVVGTPAYSAPEALTNPTGNDVDGKPGFSPRSDQFSLACTIYEALSGQRAFPGDDPIQVVAKVMTDEVPPLRTPFERASQVLMRGMAKDPARRYSSCTELAEAFAAAIEQPAEPITNPVMKAVAVVGPPPSIHRRRNITIAGGLFVIVAAGLLVGFGRQNDLPAPAASSSTTSASAPMPSTSSSTTATTTDGGANHRHRKDASP